MKKSNSTLKLVMTALLAAMTCVATMVVNIPLPATGGYINLGDCIVLLSGVILGPLYGCLAAGIGSALADLLAGYIAFAPATLVIKAFMAFIVGKLVRNIEGKRMLSLLLSGLAAEAVMVVGYFAFEAVILGYGLAALGSVVGNAIQGTVGAALAFAIAPLLGGSMPGGLMPQWLNSAALRHSDSDNDTNK